MLNQVLRSAAESAHLNTGEVDSWEMVEWFREEAGQCALRGDTFGAAYKDQQASKMAERLNNKSIG